MADGAPNRPIDPGSNMPAPSLPTAPLTMLRSTRLNREHELIDISWPLWAWIISPVDLLVVGLLAISQERVFYMGYDREADGWLEVSRFHHSYFSDPNYVWKASAALEAWLHERHEWEELTRV